MSGVGERQRQMVRPIGVGVALVVVLVVGGLWYQQRADGDLEVVSATSGVADASLGDNTTTVPPTTGTTSAPASTDSVGSPTTAEPPKVLDGDFGPPVTVGDYTQFCPALDELASLDAARSTVVDKDVATIEQWRADRRRVLTVIDQKLNYRSAEAHDAIVTLLASADDDPSAGPLSAEATAAFAEIVEFAEWSCEVNRSVPSTASVPEDGFTTTTGP